MSRIYEALQRAESERKSRLDPDEAQESEPLAASDVEGQSPGAGNPLLEHIAAHRWTPSTLFLPTLADRGECVEQFRSLRSHMYLHRLQTPMKTILVSSGMPAEGKSFVAANLALSLARNNEGGVLLIDGDLRRPTIHKVLGTSISPGLADYLAGTVPLHAIMQGCEAPEPTAHRTADSTSHVTFIPAGECGENTLELVGNHRIEELIAALSLHFDWIVIDSPPVLAVTDAVDLARAADAVLLVARGARTPFDVAQRAQAAFSNARVLGFVLNAVADAPRGGNYYNYYYGREESDLRGKTRCSKRGEG